MAECNELISKTAKAMMMVNIKAMIQIVNKNPQWQHPALQYNNVIIIDNT